MAFSNNITFVRTCPSLFKQFCILKCTYKIFICCRNEKFNLGNMSNVYPEERSINNAIKVGYELSKRVTK